MLYAHLYGSKSRGWMLTIARDIEGKQTLITAPVADKRAAKAYAQTWSATPWNF